MAPRTALLAAAGRTPAAPAATTPAAASVVPSPSLAARPNPATLPIIPADVPIPGMRGMAMAVVHIVDVVAVGHGLVAAVGTVLVPVLLMGGMG